MEETIGRENFHHSLLVCMRARHTLVFFPSSSDDSVSDDGDDVERNGCDEVFLTTPRTEVKV